MMENKFKFYISRYTPFLWLFALVNVIVMPNGIWDGDEYSLTFWFFAKRSPEYVLEWLRKEMKKRNTEFRRRAAFLRRSPAHVKKD